MDTCGPSPISAQLLFEIDNVSEPLDFNEAPNNHIDSQRIACVGRHGVKQTRTNTPRR